MKPVEKNKREKLRKNNFVLNLKSPLKSGLYDKTFFF
jgi:hypothetical protein